MSTLAQFSITSGTLRRFGLLPPFHSSHPSPITPHPLALPTTPGPLLANHPITYHISPHYLLSIRPIIHPPPRHLPSHPPLPAPLLANHSTIHSHLPHHSPNHEVAIPRPGSDTPLPPLDIPLPPSNSICRAVTGGFLPPCTVPEVGCTPRLSH